MAKAAASNVPVTARPTGTNKRMHLASPTETTKRVRLDEAPAAVQPARSAIRGKNPKHALMMEQFDLNYRIAEAKRQVQMWRKCATEVNAQLDRLRKKEGEGK
jgi:hypothetical protein